MYVWIADPELLGFTHEISRAPSTPTTVGAAICSGAMSMSTSADGADGSESPASLCATTVNECLAPFTRPLICVPGSRVS